MKIIDRYGTTLRIYDNGWRTLDRYTILPPRWDKQYKERSGLFEAIGSSDNPFAPQGFGMQVSAAPGPHLGKRIHANSLPPKVIKFARESFPEYTI